MDPLVQPSSFKEGAEILQNFFDSLKDYQQKYICNFYIRRLFLQFLYGQVITGSGGDDAIATLKSIRKFISTTVVDPVEFEGNGVTWVLQPAVVYCCGNEELDYILGKAAELGLPIVEDTYANWIAAIAPAESYFWS